MATIKMTPNNFYLIAQKYKNCINPFALTCQTTLETGYYTSELFTHANNAAGIKVTKDWKGKTYSIDSPEYYNGQKYIKRSTFRAYNNIDSFITDFVKSKIKMSRYAKVIKYGTDNFFCYFYFIWECGWATDPNYPIKLTDISFKLGPELITTPWIPKATTSWEIARSRIKTYATNKSDAEKFIAYVDKKLNYSCKPPVPQITIPTPIIINDDIREKCIRITIDAGHGGKDPGAVNKEKNINEKDITLKTAKKLKELLVNDGYDVMLTRDCDEFIELNDRANESNIWGADFLLSIHCNSTTKDTTYGHEDFYYETKDKSCSSKEGKKAAEFINTAWMSMFPDTKNRGVKGENFAMVREPNCTACLTEMDFISSTKMIDSLSNDIDKMAQALFNGITKYLNNK